MDWHTLVFETIDMRSFSNLWFWIALAVMWSTTSHWVLGVPYDMITRARRQGGEAQRDLEDIVRVNINRLLYIAEEAGVWLMGFVCFLLTGLAIAGFWYRVELCQAVFLLMFPMTFVGMLSIASARRIRIEAAEGEALQRRLLRHRLATQVIGMLSIFVTALWGMYQNLAIGVWAN
ncbi:component of SufBCD complex [Aquicoccus sp. SCR17]|nr:component of SufBCD complex [Carideicomes alvinocaridis]